MIGLIEVRVAAVRCLTPLISEYRLEALSGTLQGFSAGSHIQVHLPNGRRNAYSLVGDPASPTSYFIAVRNQENSRGGSHYMHHSLRVGDRLHVTGPANFFSIRREASLHVLVAAGVGITPFLSFIPELERSNAAFELHYAYSAGLSDAYLSQLRGDLGDRLHEYPSGTRRLNFVDLLRDRPLGTHVYVCGPQNLLKDLQASASQMSWAESRLHWETFSAAEPGQPFSAELLRSRVTVQVAADESLLEAIERVGVDVPNLCRGGVCGQCQTRWVAGDVEHRDLCLSPEERHEYLMPCVSRGCGSTISLDL